MDRLLLLCVCVCVCAVTLPITDADFIETLKLNDDPENLNPIRSNPKTGEFF